MCVDSELEGFTLKTSMELDAERAELIFRRVECTINTFGNASGARSGFVKENVWLVFEAKSVKTWNRHRRAMKRKIHLHRAFRQAAMQVSLRPTPLPYANRQ